MRAIEAWPSGAWVRCDGMRRGRRLRANRALHGMVVVQSRRLPRWALPVAGGTLAVVIGVLWWTSALWYYNGFKLP